MRREDLLRESYQRRRLKIFERKDTVQVNMPALNKLAKEESLSLINAGEFSWVVLRVKWVRSPDEIRNRVQISQPFWIKKFEVTQEEWNAFAPNNQKKGNRIFLFGRIYSLHYVVLQGIQVVILLFRSLAGRMASIFI